MTPRLRFVFEASVSVGEPVVIGTNADGIHRMVPITGGTFEGPAVRGIVLAGGADWQRTRPDGTTALEARYVLETQDGVRISVVNRGFRHGSREVMERLARGEPVAPDQYYFRAAPQFEVQTGPLDWMTRTLFVATGERRPDRVIIRVWAVE